MNCFIFILLNTHSMDILDYVTAQVPPPQANLPKPRFSLYLSSQLQYGVVLVYHRQCVFLLGKENRPNGASDCNDLVTLL